MFEHPASLEDGDLSKGGNDINWVFMILIRVFRFSSACCVVLCKLGLATLNDKKSCTCVFTLFLYSGSSTHFWTVCFSWSYYYLFPSLHMC